MIEPVTSARLRLTEPTIPESVTLDLTIKTANPNLN